MDSRQPHPFSRPPDRPLIHNPNHQAGPQPQHPPFYPPVSQQPPLQVPFPDPFQRRDPFMPSAQGQRRDSYGMGGRDTLAINGDRPQLGTGWGNGAGKPTETTSPSLRTSAWRSFLQSTAQMHPHALVVLLSYEPAVRRRASSRGSRGATTSYSLRPTRQWSRSCPVQTTVRLASHTPAWTLRA